MIEGGHAFRIIHSSTGIIHLPVTAEATPKIQAQGLFGCSSNTVGLIRVADFVIDI